MNEFDRSAAPRAAPASDHEPRHDQPAGPRAWPAHDHAARRGRVRGDDLLLVTDPVSVRYLSGFTGTNGQLLVAPDADADRLITDDRYRERAALEAPDLDLIRTRDPAGAALDAVTGAGAAGARLAVEADHLTWAAARDLLDRAQERGVEVEPTTDRVSDHRRIKDDAEIARLAEACAITERSLAWLVAEVVAPGRSERGLARDLERRFVDDGADGVAFPSIVASGPNAAVPHHEPGERTLRPGDVLTIDCGALVDGYHADHTRTVAVGHLDGWLTEIHQVVMAAQAAGRAAVVAGAAAKDVDQAARSVIDDAGYGERFVHGTGHGVGLEIHEAPAVGQGSAGRLLGGMALTVEPGIYLPGLGGVRIEDTLVVAADGPARHLTDSPRDLVVIEAAGPVR